MITYFHHHNPLYHPRPTRGVSCALRVQSHAPAYGIPRAASKCNQPLAEFHKAFRINILHILYNCIFMHEICKITAQTTHLRQSVLYFHMHSVLCTVHNRVVRHVRFYICFSCQATCGSRWMHRADTDPTPRRQGPQAPARSDLQCRAPLRASRRKNRTKDRSAWSRPH